MRQRTTPSRSAGQILAAAGPTVSVHETAVILGVSKDTCYSAVVSGELPARVLRVGRRIRVVTADLKRELGWTADSAETGGDAA